MRPISFRRSGEIFVIRAADAFRAISDLRFAEASSPWPGRPSVHRDDPAPPPLGFYFLPVLVSLESFGMRLLQVFDATMRVKYMISVADEA